MKKMPSAAAAAEFSDFLKRLIDADEPSCILAMTLTHDRALDDGRTEFRAQGRMLTLGVTLDTTISLLRALAEYATCQADDIEGVRQ